MFRYQIKIEYDGTDFVGWQYQKNGKSVQGVLQKILLQFLKKKISSIIEFLFKKLPYCHYRYKRKGSKFSRKAQC